jgi:hypothetical protein
VAVIAAFGVVSQLTRAAIRRQVAAVSDGAHLDDIVLTPMPSNLFCWNVITAEHREGIYRMRRGTFAPYPAVFPVASCPRFRTERTLAPLSPATGNWDARFQWEGQYEGRLADLASARAADCQFADFLRFARAPFLVDTPRGKVAGDLRFDFGPELGFAAMRLPTSGCPSWVPPWTEPRRDWLEAAARDEN